MQLSTQGSDLLLVSENGLGKRTSINEFRSQHRGGKGVKCYKINKRTGHVLGAKLVNEDDEIMIISSNGTIIRLLVSNISKLLRITSGVKLMNVDLDSENKVASIAKVRESKQSKSIDEVVKELEEELEEELDHNLES